MTKEELIERVKNGKSEHEDYYINGGPDKHEQEECVNTGVQVVQMNVGLLESWLDENELSEAYYELPAKDKREVWEASDFHFGICGYDADDADFFWAKQAKREAK